MTVLTVDAIHTYYGESHVLQGVSLRVDAGEVVALLGRNGAGKTTTLKSIMGIVPARRGTIRFDGADITRLPPHLVARRRIAWIPEERRIVPNLTVYENLRLAMLKAPVDGKEASARLEEALAFFPRLRERLTQNGKSLSGGEQQMLAIARGLVAGPALMLVDEPTEGLMPIIVRNLTEILHAINARGTSMLLVEQNLEVALALARRVYLIDQGRIEFEGTPDDLRGHPDLLRRYLGV
ncbi:MAG: ABC transporter ATP-binding protein [Candidatus Rokubacteria bacterium]|nr:ABC transporter ATP-binding protein [Candidatus Rokubacteria bacterium]